MASPMLSASLTAAATSACAGSGGSRTPTTSTRRYGFFIPAGGLPSPATVAAVQAYIDDVRPVTAKNALVLAPTEKPANVSVLVLLAGTTLAVASPLIQAAITGYFASLEPGEPAIKSRIEALVSAVPGVVDRSVSLPAANVVPVVDASKVEWVRLGSITVGLMP